MCSIDTLPEDLLFEIGSYLSLEDELKINYKLRDTIRKIQLWYKKYKRKRDIRYSTLYKEFQKRNEKILECYYANVFFSLYNIRKLRKTLNEYYFLSLINYFYRSSEQRESILCLYNKTLEKPTYTNLKIFLKRLPVKLILRC
jgi:hypothetical protein